jgi:hypothetical protein
MLRRFALALVALALMAAPATAADLRSIAAPLTGAEEVPPVDTDAVGVATIRLSTDRTELSYRLIAANIDDVTQAHIHCGSPAVAGPVVAFLYGFQLIEGTFQGVLATGTITDADVIARPDSPACPGGVSADLDDIIAKIRSGEAYVNVHTVAFPAGEIGSDIR